jgi:hypothetical protein
MPHTMQPGPLPNITIVNVYGEMQTDDLLPDLKLDEAPKYLLFDVTKVDLSVPENFWDAARKTPLTHPNCIHAAVVMRSEALKNLAVAVTKLARVRDKVTFFKTYEEALDHLMHLAKQGQR